MSNTIKLDITEGQISNAIAVAVAEAFTPERKDAMIRDILRAHLTVKSRDYDKETLFSQVVTAQLKDMVKDFLAKEVEAMRPQVEAVVAERFPGLETQVLDQLKSQLGRIAITNLSISVRLE